MRKTAGVPTDTRGNDGQARFVVRFDRRSFAHRAELPAPPRMGCELDCRDTENLQYGTSDYENWGPTVVVDLVSLAAPGVVASADACGSAAIMGLVQHAAALCNPKKLRRVRVTSGNGVSGKLVRRQCVEPAISRFANALGRCCNCLYYLPACDDPDSPPIQRRRATGVDENSHTLGTSDAVKCLGYLEGVAFAS